MKIRLVLLIALMPFLAGCGDDEPDSGKQSVVDISGGEQTDDGFRYGDFYYTFGDNVATIAKADKLIVNSVIPAKVRLNGEFFDVTKIGSKAFSGCSAMRSITIPSSITTIYSSFYDCSSLTKVEVLDLAAWCKISFNGYDANPLRKGTLYHNGRELKELTIPTSVTKIGDQAFSGHLIRFFETEEGKDGGGDIAEDTVAKSHGSLLRVDQDKGDGV